MNPDMKIQCIYKTRQLSELSNFISLTLRYQYLLICILCVMPDWICAEEIFVRKVGELTYITHVDKFESKEEAKVACYEFLYSINTNNPYCSTRIWTRDGREPLVSAGNFKEADSYTWHALFYFYPNFFLAPDFEPMQCPMPKEGNPCSPVTGIKRQIETDYVSARGTLKVQRYYASHSLEGTYSPLYSYYSEWGFDDGVSDLGPRWRHNYDFQMDGDNELDYKNYKGVKSRKYSTPSLACVSGWNSIKNNYPLLSDSIAAYRDGLCDISLNNVVLASLVVHNTLFTRKGVGASSQILTFTRPSSSSLTLVLDTSNQWLTLRPSQVTLNQDGENWHLKTSNGEVETYGSDGKLISKKSTTGHQTIFTYGNEGRLATVTDHFGDILSYYYDESGYLASIATPEGRLSYGYDSNGRLETVTYPDNLKRQYHYEDTRFPNNLTGITDENGIRYATWAYDAKGRAILSEHANSADRVEFTYNPDGTTTVTDAAGSERIYHFTVQQRQMKVDHIEGDRCTTCAGGGIKSYTYDSNGFVASKTDWNGNTTTYTRDDRGRELSRTEASDTSQARTITTTWDTTLNKPLTVTDPEQITEYRYDADGRLLSQQQSAIQ